jgi:Short C-terminal domain
MSIAARLGQLQQLRESGALTDEEFAKAKQAALEGGPELVIDGIWSDFCNVMGQGKVDGQPFEFDGYEGHWSFVVWEEGSAEGYWLEGDWDQQDRLNSAGSWEHDLREAEAIIRRCAAEFRTARLA